MSGEVISDLTPIGILSFLDQESLEALKYHGTFGEYGPGEVIINEGERQYSLWYVISGTMEVYITTSAKEVKVAEIGPGDCLGEVSVFEPGEASASVRVMETAVLWNLDVSQLQTFFEKLPIAGGQLMLGIAQLLSRRLRDANQQIMQNQLTPKHLSVRSSTGAPAPIKADTVNTPEKGGSGLFGLFGGASAKDKPKISTEIKK
ncbi:MAG: cyclic nucleotide-binding domain-containing protein [Verrucomicrobiota bacterium]